MENREKINKPIKIAIIVSLIFSLSAIIIPRIYNFLQQDACLDEGGSYNSETKKCEKISQNQEFLSEITYSNLADKASQEEVKLALQKAGIEEKNIENFFESVNNFNQTIENVSLNSGFEISKNLSPTYDEGIILEKWQVKNPEFIGHNCRITTYNLMRNFIKIENPSQKDDSELFMDKDAISLDPQKLFSDEEKQIFESFYSKIPTILTKDIWVHTEKIKKNWTEKWITFPFVNDKTKASLISVWFHSHFEWEEDYLFIGHIWVLFPMENDKLIFVEKLSFSEPYQAIKFNNRMELNDYLMAKYDVEFGQENASPFIFENGELLEEYRKNPLKQWE